jgi:hypothetical protein
VRQRRHSRRLRHAPKHGREQRDALQAREVADAIGECVCEAVGANAEVAADMHTIVHTVLQSPSVFTPSSSHCSQHSYQAALT